MDWTTKCFDLAEEILADVKGANENDVAKLADQIDEIVNGFIAKLGEPDEPTEIEGEEPDSDDEPEPGKPRDEDVQ